MRGGNGKICGHEVTSSGNLVMRVGNISTRIRRESVSQRAWEDAVWCCPLQQHLSHVSGLVGEEDREQVE